MKEKYVPGVSKIENCIFPSVDNWINNINRAEFVVTDSFHGAVFSILFNKPFVVILNHNRGGKRFLSVLSLFNLGNRMVSDTLELKNRIHENIDFSPVNNQLYLLRETSLRYLTHYLGDETISTNTGI